MNPYRPGPMSAPGEQPSAFHIHLDPAIRSQGTGSGSPVPVPALPSEPCERALALLGNLQARQAGLPRSAALAWERAAFAEVFGHPGPRQRIRGFLERD
jgi:hypothetical protein